MAKTHTHSERIVILETNFSYMKNKVDKIENTVNNIDEKMDSLVEKLDTRYARKTSVDKIRKIIWAIIGFVFVGIGGVLLKMLLKQ